MSSTILYGPIRVPEASADEWAAVRVECRGLEEPAGLAVGADERVDLGPERGVPRAGPVQVRRPLGVGRTVQGGGKERLQVFVGWFHGVTP